MIHKRLLNACTKNKKRFHKLVKLQSGEKYKYPPCFH